MFYIRGCQTPVHRLDLAPACSVPHMNGSYCSDRDACKDLTAASRGLFGYLLLRRTPGTKVADPLIGWPQRPLGAIVGIFTSICIEMVRASQIRDAFKCCSGLQVGDCYSK